MSADPVSDAMWADLRAAEVRSVQAAPLVGFAISPAAAFDLLRSLGMLECGCPSCSASRHAHAGCDGCADLGYAPCGDHQARR